MYLADWHGYDVVYSKCANRWYYEDCLHGMQMVEGLQSEFVVQLIGICYNDNLEVNTYFVKLTAAYLTLIVNFLILISKMAFI